MRLDNLQLACVQPPTSLQIRPLRLSMQVRRNTTDRQISEIRQVRRDRRDKRDRRDRRHQTLRQEKHDSHLNLCRAAFAILAMFISAKLGNCILGPSLNQLPD